MTGRTDEPPSLADRLAGPEVVAAVLAVLVVGVLAASTFARGSQGPFDGASPSPTLASSPIAPAPSPAVDLAVVDLLRALNLQLADYGRLLQAALDGPFRTADAAPTIRQINATVRHGSDALNVLGGATGDDEVGGRLGAVYRSIAATATETLDAALTNTTEYRLGSGVLVELIGDLPALQAELDALAVGPPPSAAPSPSAPPTTAPPSGSPPPSAPVSSAAPDEQIIDGGFEAGVGLPWTLRLAPGTSATLVADPEGPTAGATAARIDITTNSPAYSGVSLQQSGLQLEAGAQYTLSISLRARTEREVRIRVASPDGASYLTRIAPVSTSWTVQSFVFTAPVSDDLAVLAVDLGRSEVSTWLDAVSFRPLGLVSPSPSP